MNLLFEDGMHSLNAVSVSLISIFYREDDRTRVLMLVRMQVFSLSIFSLLKESIRKNVVFIFSLELSVKIVLGVWSILQSCTTCNCIIYNFNSCLLVYACSKFLM